MPHFVYANRTHSKSVWVQMGVRSRKSLDISSYFPIDTPRFRLPWNLDYAVSRVWPACNGTHRQSTYCQGSSGIQCDWNSRPDNHAKSSLGTRRQCWFSHGIRLPCTGNGEFGTRQNCPHVGCNRLHPVTGAVASGAIPGRRENDWCSSFHAVLTEILVASRGDGDVGKGIEAGQRLEYQLEGETPLLEESEKRLRMYESPWKRTGCSSFSVSAMTRFRTWHPVSCMASTSKNTCNGGFSSLTLTPSAGGEGRREVEGTSSLLECTVAKPAAAPRRQQPGLRLARHSACSVMVTRRTHEVATQVFLLLFATHKEFATVAALPTTRTDAQLLVIRGLPSLCLRHVIGETRCPIECPSTWIAGLHCRNTSALGLGVIWTSSLDIGTAVVWVVVAGMETLVVVGFETPHAEVGGAKESG